LLVVLAGPAVIVGSIVIFGLVASGSPIDIENSYGVLLVWVVDVPIGLLILAYGLFRLRGRYIVTSLVVLSLPIITILLASYPSVPTVDRTDHRTEVIIHNGGVLTSQPITLKGGLESAESPLLYAGHIMPNTPVTVLEITTGPITYPEEFSVNVYMNAGNANGASNIKDSNLIGSFGLPADDRRRNEAGQGDGTLIFGIPVGSAFYKLVQLEKPFSVILLPAGRAATDPNFRIPVNRIDLTVTCDRWVYCSVYNDLRSL
jgi:hypothetical protein